MSVVYIYKDLQKEKRIILIRDASLEFNISIPQLRNLYNYGTIKGEKISNRVYLDYNGLVAYSNFQKENEQFNKIYGYKNKLKATKINNDVLK